MDFSQINVMNKEYVSDSTASCMKSASVAGNAERAASDKIATDLTLFADKVRVEEFKFSPEAQNGWVPFSAFLCYFAYVCYFFIPVLSALLVAMAFLPVILFFTGRTELLGLFFGERLSQNVYAIKRAANDPKRRIVFCTHVDAPDEMPVRNRYGQRAVNLLCILSAIGGLYFIALSTAACVLNGTAGFSISQGIPMILGLVGMIFLPFWAFLCRMVGKKSDKADYATPYVLIDLLKEMKEKSLCLSDTELGVLILGAEEHGAVGAKVFEKSVNSDIETVYVCLRNGEELSISQKVNIIPGDEDVCALLKLSGYEIGADIPYITKQGRKHTAVQALGKCRLKASELNVCREKRYDDVYSLILKTIELYDKNGLNDLYEESGSATTE